MLENENLVAEANENVEHTTEETPKKMFTQDELNDAIGKAKARERAKITKQYERQNSELYELVETLKAGTGKEGVRELNDAFTDFYESKGLKINKKREFSEKDIERLANADADEFISGGFEDVIEEAERLKQIGVDKMTAREKATFAKLAAYVKNTEQARELAKIGVTEDVYNSSEFKEFQSMFKENTPISKVYEQYLKTQPKKEIRTAGSMKQSQDYKGVKEYYSPEEIERLTEEDLDDPKVWEAVRRSMTGR